MTSHLLPMHFTQIYKQEENTRGAIRGMNKWCLLHRSHAQGCSLSQYEWGSPENTKVLFPGQGKLPGQTRKEQGWQAWRCLLVNSHLSISLLHCAHMGRTANCPAAHTPLTAAKERQTLRFPTKMTHFSATTNLFWYILFWICFHVCIIRYSTE